MNKFGIQQQQQPKWLCLLVILLLISEPAVVVSQQQQQQVRVTSGSDRVALLQLRSSLGVRAKEWPLKSDPCLNWKGISCVNGSVTGVNISGFRRTRIGRQNPRFAVDSLANLTSLAYFNASSFTLPGAIPSWFGDKMSNLQVLDLGFCSIQGLIPVNIGNSSRLTTLILSNNGLNGSIPSSLGQLARLSLLDLSHNFLNESIPDSFSLLSNLSFLDISSNSLSGQIPPGIGILSNLKYLNLSNNGIAFDIPPQLGDLSSLVDLDLGFNALVNTLPSDLRGLRSLKTMVVGNNRLSGPIPDDLFRALTRLEVVVLSHNNFSGAIPNGFWSMNTLQNLDVSNNNFTGELPTVVLRPNRTFALLNLSNNQYYGVITLVLRRFGSIDLSANYFEGRVPNFLRSIGFVSENCLQNVTDQRTRNECASFYSSKGKVFDNFGVPSTKAAPPVPEQVPKKKSNKRTIILAAVLGGVGLLLVFLLLLLFLCARRKGGTRQRGVGVGPTPPTDAELPSHGTSINFSNLGEKFTYDQLLQATGNFSDANLIKNGQSGDLFRGLLESGVSVVIKRINLNSVKLESYTVELEFLRKISHTRLVSLMGYCLEKEDEKYFVYKHMPNVDLSSSLFRKVSTVDDGLQSLDWITRLKIATGAAEALSYLHHECTPPFVHRDVQASSILLDDKFEVRLGSLSQVCVQGGNSQPRAITRLLRLPQSSEHGPSGSQTSTCAYDVYCFGKVLLELVTGKLGMSASSDARVKEWLDQTLPNINIYDKELVTKIIDPSLIYDEDLLEEVWAMAIIAKSCLNPKPSRRPLMRYILKALENPLKIVRYDNTSSARLRATSSRSSWNASVFESWRQNSDTSAARETPITRVEGPGSFKKSVTFGSQGSGPVLGVDHSSSQLHHSREIYPEPRESV